MFILNNITKKTVCIFYLLLIVCCSIRSQDTSRITITSDQLRTTNLIFAEHKKYSKLVPLLQIEITNLKTVNTILEKTDSIKSIQIYQQSQIITQKTNEINQLKQQFKTKSTVGMSVVGISLIVTVLCLLLN